MKIAVIGTSRKENEKRVAIHPSQISLIPEEIRSQLVFEKGYGVDFGMNDDRITSLTGNQPRERKYLYKNFNAFLITKPVIEDFKEMKDGSLVWGWVHSVMQEDVTQIAIDKKLTLIAWENMHYNSTRGRTHIFQKNNEMAGYCGVQHALQLRGIDGNFGADKRVSILSLGSVSRGSIYALKGHGFEDITVYTRRPSHLVADRLPGVTYRQLTRGDDNRFVTVNEQGEEISLIEELAQSDIIVNGVLQDQNNPSIFVTDTDVEKFENECLVVDISCDDRMGFSFAHPTSFEHPLFKVGKITYYSVDHTPTLLWDSASWEISKSVLPFLKDVIEQNPNEILDAAVDFRDGIIINQDIITVQNRETVYPYKRIGIVDAPVVKRRSLFRRITDSISPSMRS